jgi:hypothetical protein
LLPLVLVWAMVAENRPSWFWLGAVAIETSVDR